MNLLNIFTVTLVFVSSAAFACPAGSRCAPTVTMNDIVEGRRNWFKDCMNQALGSGVQTSKDSKGNPIRYLRCSGEPAGGFFVTLQYRSLKLREGKDEKMNSYQSYQGFPVL